jgi:hypothetical protein
MFTTNAQHTSDLEGKAVAQNNISTDWDQGANRRYTGIGRKFQRHPDENHDIHNCTSAGRAPENKQSA